MSKKKEIIVIVLIITVALVGVIGTTLAVFSTGNKQTGLNSFKSGCLNITIENESAALSLSKSYPITDIEGIESSPYTFTIRNTCSTPTNYQINLESINEKSNTLNGDYVKVSLSSDTMDNVISTLTSNTSITSSLDNAYAAYNLYTGVLEGNSSKTYNLKEWIEYNATIEQAANKVYESRISVIANPDLLVTDKPEIKTVLASNTLTGTITGETSTVKYCATTDNICTPNTNVSLSDNTISIDISTIIPTSTKTISTALGNLEVNANGKGMVCSQIGNGKTYCSNPVENKRCSDTFSSIATTDEGICEAEDDWGTSYYYRGTVDDNWVQFAGFYWRIIRINGDGSIRMIYNGTSTTATGVTMQLGTKAFNTTYNNAEYIGIKYTMESQHGTGTNSTILGTSTSTDITTLNGWYNSKIKGTQYEQYVKTNGQYCSDRNVASGHSKYPGTTGTGYAATVFAPADRLLGANLSSWKTSQTPTLKCTSASDRLTMPVGLITSDEVVFAGGLGGKMNNRYYLYTNTDYWTMSPNYFSGGADEFYVSAAGDLYYGLVINTYGVRPVINISSNVTITGSGTVDSPFQVVS